MSRPLPRYLDDGRERLEFEQKLARILLEVGKPAPAPKLYAATAGGDGRRLRGIPAHAKGTGGGAIAGTDPLRALLVKERHGRGPP